MAYELSISSDPTLTTSDLAAGQAIIQAIDSGNRIKILAKDANGDVTTSYIRSSQRYVALLTQTSTGAPSATVLENDIGTLVFARTSAGLYTITLTGAFSVNKTVVMFGTPIHVNNMGTVEAVLTSADVITFTTIDYKTSDDTSAPLDGMLTKTAIVIEVFP